MLETESIFLHYCAGLSLINLGTLMVSDVQPENTQIPTGSPNCNKTSCTGKVWIFFTDSRLSIWGTIYAARIHSRDRKIICNQLGYSDSDNKHYPKNLPPANDSVPVWFYSINCANLSYSATNILQCNPTVCEHGSMGCNHENDLTIKCSKYG